VYYNRLMFRLSENLRVMPVVSLRTGGRIAATEELIINPHNLKVEGWYCKDAYSKETLILVVADVREIMPQGIAVDDHSALVEPGELIRLKEVLDIQFSVLGKGVVTESGQRLGKVSEFALDSDSFFVAKLYVAQPIYKNIAGGQLVIDRDQIVEITDKKITVKDTTEPLKATAFTPVRTLP